MNKNFCVLDIETVPDETVPADLKPSPAYGNAKKPEAKEKILGEWRQEGGEAKAMSLHPFLCKIVSVQIWSGLTGCFLDMAQDDEAQLIEEVGVNIRNHDLIVGKAIIGFDLPVLRARAMILGVDFPDVNMPRYRRSPVYDIQEILTGWDTSKRKGMTQDFIARRLGVEGKTADGSQVYNWWKAGKKGKIHQYCKDDVISERDTFLKMIDYYPA